MSPGRLRDELAQWVDLNLNHQVPTTLMILSRAFSFTDRTVSTEDALRATFNSLPDNLVGDLAYSPSITRALLTLIYI